MKFLLILFSIIALLLFARLWIGQGSYPDIWYLEKQITYQKESNEAQQDKNRKLRAEVEDLQSGDDAIEEYARSELGMIRRGEKFYQVILKEPENDNAESDATNTNVMGDKKDNAK